MLEIAPQEYVKGTIELRSNIEQGFLVLGERLFNIKKKELWKGSYESYQDFLLAIRLSEGTDSKLRVIYKRFILQYKLPIDSLVGCGWSSLYTIAANVLDRDKAIALIEKANNLKRDDFIQEMRELHHGEHECTGETMTFLKCATCKKLTRKS